MGLTGLLNIMITVICIWVAWWAMQGFRFDIFMRNPTGRRAKVLMIMISIIMGYLVASFIIDYLQWSLVLKQLF